MNRRRRWAAAAGSALAVVLAACSDVTDTGSDESPTGDGEPSQQHEGLTDGPPGSAPDGPTGDQDPGEVATDGADPDLSGQTQVDALDDGTYVIVAETADIMFSLPDGWDQPVASEDDADDVAFLASADEAETPEEDITFLITATPSDMDDAQAYLAVVQDFRPAGAEVSEADPIFISGSDEDDQEIAGVRVELPENEDLEAYVQFSYPVFIDGLLYEFQVGAHPDQEADAEDALAEILDTVEILRLAE